MVLDDGIMRDMNMVSDRGNDSGTVNNARDIDILQPQHPIVAKLGVKGRLTVSDRGTQMTFGRPGPQATIIATVNGNRNEAAIFAYLKGDALVRNARDAVARTARNRRVGFFLRENGIRDLRKDGEDLFEAALNWTWSGDGGNGTSVAPTPGAPAVPAAGGAVY
jgi:hypothetical protein